MTVKKKKGKDNSSKKKRPAENKNTGTVGTINNKLVYGHSVDFK